MKTEILKGDVLAKVFISGTGNPDLDGAYVLVQGTNPTETPTSFNDGAGFDLTSFVQYEIKTILHSIYDIELDITKVVKDNTDKEYIKIII